MISVDSTDKTFALEMVILTDHPVTLNIHGARCGTVSVSLMNGSGASRLFGAIAQEGKQETFLTRSELKPRCQDGFSRRNRCSIAA